MLSSLGSIERELGKEDEGINLLQRAVDVTKASGTERDPVRVGLYLDLAEARLGQARTEEARVLIGHALSVLEEQEMPDAKAQARARALQARLGDVGVSGSSSTSAGP